MHSFHLQKETFHLVRPQEEVLIPLAPQSLPSDISFGFLELLCLYLQWFASLGKCEAAMLHY
jgi:hypothetical protein